MNDLHEQFCLYGKKALEWRRKCELLLPAISDQRIWEKKGYSSIYEYAAKLAGMSRIVVDDSLRIMERIKGLPKIQEIAKESGLNRVKPLMTVVNHENETFWAEKAKSMGKHTLETYVKEYKHQNGIKNFPGKIEMELSSETINQLNKLKGEKSWEDLMQEFLKQREQQKPKAVQTEKRYIPTQIRQFVYHRTNGKCAFSTCKKPGVVQHHRERFAATNKHDPDEMFLLCKAHHNLCHTSLVDEQNWEIRKDPKYNWVDKKVLLHQRR
jgi:hypothetical protein